MKIFDVDGSKLTAFTMDPLFERAVSLVENQAKSRRREDKLSWSDPEPRASLTSKNCLIAAV